MQAFPALPAFHLRRRQAVRLHARLGERVECRSGQLWVTQDGDPRDVVLAANQFFVVDRPGPVVVSALEDAAFVFRRETARQASAPRRSPAGAPVALPRAAY
ncbi:MAG: DUF2917 domain-containing protein [Rhizobacter sp.]|nr:DUF2917 domain-containing protein [Rhizobacter sp.]